MYAFWQPNRALADAARWNTGQAPWVRTPSVDLAILFTLGAVAAIATSVAPGAGLRIPGHAILRGAVPLILGMSLVPRRSAGTAVSMAAAATFGAMRLAGFGLPNPAAAVGLLCLGPASDLAVAGSRGGLWLYVRFAAGGLAANLAAFAVRIATGPAAATPTRRTWAPGSGMGGGGGMGMGGGRGMGMGRGAGRGIPAEPIEAFWSTALLSFALCGALAGLLCAWIWFRARTSSDKAAAP